MKRLTHRSPSEIFTGSMARQLLKIHEHGPFEYRNGAFRNGAGDVIYMQSILAMYERFLITVVAESKHRVRQTAYLTEIGKHVVLSLLHERDGPKVESPHRAGKISEASALLTQEIVAS